MCAMHSGGAVITETNKALFSADKLRLGSQDCKKADTDRALYKHEDEGTETLLSFPPREKSTGLQIKDSDSRFNSAVSNCNILD